MTDRDAIACKIRKARQAARALTNDVRDINRVMRYVIALELRIVTRKGDSQ